MNLWRSTYEVLVKVMKWSVMVAVLCNILILLICVIDIIGSKFFNLGIPGAVVFVEQLNLVLVFMAVAYTQVERGNIGVAFLNKYLSTGLNQAIKLTGYVLGILVCGFFSWRTLVLMLNMIATRDIANTSAIEFPLWPFAMVNLWGYVLLTIAFILCLVREQNSATEKKDSI
jgi:TRAP-type C4-dicarboxylate transport system permease small subunit